jgi:hypothetical protein
MNSYIEYKIEIYPAFNAKIFLILEVFGNIPYDLQIYLSALLC